MAVTPKVPPKSKVGLRSILGSEPSAQPSMMRGFLPLAEPLLCPLLLRGLSSSMSGVPSRDAPSDLRVLRRLVPGVSTKPSGRADLLEMRANRRSSCQLGVRLWKLMMRMQRVLGACRHATAAIACFGSVVLRWDKGTADQAGGGNSLPRRLARL
jgi:hypothetical protein